MLNASDAYVRRLLLRQRLYGIKVGTVWAMFPDYLDAFRRMRRPPGRPRKHDVSASDELSAALISSERKGAGTGRFLRKTQPSALKPKRRRSSAG